MAVRSTQCQNRAVRSTQGGRGCHPHFYVIIIILLILECHLCKLNGLVCKYRLFKGSTYTLMKRRFNFILDLSRLRYTKKFDRFYLESTLKAHRFDLSSTRLLLKYLFYVLSNNIQQFELGLNRHIVVCAYHDLSFAVGSIFTTVCVRGLFALSV